MLRRSLVALGLVAVLVLARGRLADLLLGPVEPLDDDEDVEEG